MTELEKMSAGMMYNPTSPDICAARLRARVLVDRFNRTRASNFSGRERILKKLIPNQGPGLYVEPSIRVEYGFNVSCGKNFYMNFDCQLLDVAQIRVGDNVMFGPRVIVATPIHPLVADERIMQDYPDGFHDLEYSRPVSIGDNVWVASGVVICGGVTIGSDSVIAAGSVVTRDIPSGVLAGGVPCKVIRAITDEDRINPAKIYGYR